MEPLERYIAQYPKITLVRAPERVGLIRARLMGASAATAEVLTYLDSHCECSEVRPVSSPGRGHTTACVVIRDGWSRCWTG